MAEMPVSLSVEGFLASAFLALVVFSVLVQI